MACLICGEPNIVDWATRLAIQSGMPEVRPVLPADYQCEYPDRIVYTESWGYNSLGVILDNQWLIGDAAIFVVDDQRKHFVDDIDKNWNLFSFDDYYYKVSVAEIDDRFGNLIANWINTHKYDYFISPPRALLAANPSIDLPVVNPKKEVSSQIPINWVARTKSGRFLVVQKTSTGILSAFYVTTSDFYYFYLVPNNRYYPDWVKKLGGVKPNA